MPVYYKCKICGEKHLSPIAFTRESFQSSTISGALFKCAKTGRAAKYDTTDMFWEAEEPSPQ